MGEAKKATIWNKAYICAMIANVMLCMSQNIVNTLVSTYASFLGAGTVIVGMVSGLYFAVSFAARPFSGPAITKFNKKTIMIISYALGIVVNIGYALSNGVGMFVLARILHGLQFAFIGSLNLTLAADALPAEKMGSGLGIFGAAGAIAMAIGPTIGITLRDSVGAVLGEAAGYSSVFFAAALCMLVSLIPCIIIPVKRNSVEENKSLGVWYKNIMASEALVPSIVLIVFTMAANTYMTYMVPYAAEKGIGNISLYFTVYALTLLAARPLCGRLVDKLGTSTVFYPSIAFLAASFVVVSVSKTLAGCMVGGVLAAIGYGAGQPALQSIIMQCVPALKRGVASNTAYFGMDLGFFLGPMLGGVWIKYFGYSKMFLCMMGMLLLGALFFGVSWKPYNKWLAKRSEHWKQQELE